MARAWRANITPTERIARIVVGGLGVLTGALGHYPLYARLGHVPPSLKEKTS